MPISKATLSQAEKNALISHASKHKIYPYPFVFNKTINGTNFPTSDGSLGSYFTMTMTAGEILPIVSLATSFIVTPNTTIGLFALIVSYQKTVSMADAASLSATTFEGSKIYQLLSNGGAINDFQVFYPLNWYMERNSQIYVHVWADATTVTAASSTMVGQCIFGTMPTGE